ncbi:uncharacterized protein PFL1_02985 [Pseudozyma flocculosa PF-1]|uniref:Peptidase M20 dimerisation domain-containing protein n=2 Tax=Pseudozyma flocculosa TaxID=84751 RepID=A0A061HB18_9BASI|nr:uncharacterized protein PFL1_02985 [Pseudozyma flocculosa PF-1]EPQ29230.1 hypothetical protein PFL1_02985 [Pseudozyma flocculosa PF-1]SPO37730.1 related to DUG2 - putative di- and tri-peptidase [Pseudozyma flocculosa]
MCSPNVHYDHRPRGFSDNPFEATASIATDAYPPRSGGAGPSALDRGDAPYQRTHPTASDDAASGHPYNSSSNSSGGGSSYAFADHRHRSSAPGSHHNHHRHQGHPDFPGRHLTASAVSSSSSTAASASLHHTITHSSSVLSLAVDEQRGLVFSGSQSECIYVWDLATYQRTTRLEGHTGSVLALELAPERNWLFSSSGDNTVRIWDTHSLRPLYVVYPAEDNVGDIFALKWCSELQTLYLGCQNTSIQWICLEGIASSASNGSQAATQPGAATATPAGGLAVRGSAHGGQLRGSDSPKVATPGAFPVSRPHRFFDSVSLSRSRSTNTTAASAAAASGKTARGAGTGGSATPQPPPPPLLRSRISEGHLGNADGDGGGIRAAGPEATGPATRPHAQHPGAATDEVISAASARLSDMSLTVPDALRHPEAAVLDPDSSFKRAVDASAENGAVVETLVVPPACSVPSAHFGYIYTFAILTLEGDHPHRKVLASGSGDEAVKLWHATPEGLVHLATLESPNTDGNAVMALASWKSTLFAGLQGGDVEVWDLETCTLVRTLRAHDDDVLALEACSYDGCLFTASADGRIRRWDRSFRCTDQWKAHDGIILSLASIRQPVPPGQPNRPRPVLQLVTGSSDDLIKIWNLPQRDGGAGRSSEYAVDGGGSRDQTPSAAAVPSAPGSSTLLSSLAQFVRYRSVSSVEENREDCRQAAHFLKACLSGLGAEAKILANLPGRNPLVLATFKANGSQSRSRSLSRSRRPSEQDRGDATAATGVDADAADGRSGPLSSSPPPTKRCLFYGHYDCIDAEGQWDSDPFQMDGRDGYLYGRGVSDNKGPILAAACAASQLLSQRQLDADVVFLIEGEEETGSIGFTEAVRAHKDDIGHIDVILLSNSYWLGEDTPCLTVGLRGVVRATIEVSGDEPDVHSGVEGGAVREPMIDMVKLLSSLSSGAQVTIPGFYDAVRPVTPAEVAQYESIARIKLQAAQPSSASTAEAVAACAQSLMAKWRHPSLSVHHLRVSGPGNSTVIPSKVSATVSLRIVPDQSLSAIESALQRHIDNVFAGLRAGGSANAVHVVVEHRADWWSGSSSPYFTHLERAVRDVWGLSSSSSPDHDGGGGPISIREGGSIPAIAILEKELRAEAVHLPMGQSSDSAHLPNERIRLVNLRRGRDVVARFLCALGQEHPQQPS